MRLRFWLMGGLRVLGTILGASALYAFFMWIQMEDSTYILTLLPLYLILFGAVMLMAMTLGLYKMMLSLSLSFGSTRREAMMGIHIYRLLPCLGTTAMVALLTAVPGVEFLFSLQSTILVCLGAFLLCGALGAVLGLIYYRFGKLGAILSVVCMVLLAFAGGFLAVLSVDQSDWLQRLFSTVPASWLTLALGAAVYLIVMIPERLVLRKYQVKM